MEEENKRVWETVRKRGRDGMRTDGRTDGLRSALFALKLGDLVLPTAVDCSRDLHPLNREQLILQARRFSIWVALHSDSCSWLLCSSYRNKVEWPAPLFQDKISSDRKRLFCISFSYVSLITLLYLECPFVCIKRRDVQHKSPAHTEELN